LLEWEADPAEVNKKIETDDRKSTNLNDPSHNCWLSEITDDEGDDIPHCNDDEHLWHNPFEKIN